MIYIAKKSATTATTGTTATTATTAATVLQLLQVLLRLLEHNHYSTNSGGRWPGTVWAVLHQVLPRNSVTAEPPRLVVHR